MSTASLEASLRLEIAQYQAQLAKARGDAQRFKESIKREGYGLGGALFGKMGTALSGMLPAVGVASAVAGLHSIVSAADDLADAATKLDTTPQTFQRVQAAAEILGGTDMDTVTSALIRLRRQLIDDPGSALAQGLEQVGIKAADFLRLDADEQILQLADAYAKAQQSGVALPLLNEAFGKSFKELIPLLSQGSESIRAYYNETATATDNSIARLAEANDRLDGYIKRVKNWATEATASVLGLGEALLTGGKSLEEGQAKADAAAMKAIAAREAQAREANEKKITADAKAATKAAGIENKPGGGSGGGKGGDPFAEALSKQQRFEDAKRRLEEDSMTRTQKIEALKAQLATQTPEDPFGTAGPGANLEAETKRLELQRELNRLIREQSEEIDKVKQKMSEEQDRFAERFQKQNEAKQSLQEEIQLAAAKARGDTEAVVAMERELAIREKAKEIMASTNASEAQARASAAMLIRLQEQSANQEATKPGQEASAPGHIGGVKKRRYMGGGLDEFARNQQRDGMAGTAFGSDSLSSRRGPLADNSPLASRSSMNAARSDAAESAARNSSRDPNTQLLAAMLELWKTSLSA